MLVRADKPADGGVARGEQKAGARRLGQQRLDVGLAPHVIHHDQRRLAGDGGAVLVLAGQGSVVAAEVVAQRLGHLAHLLDEVALPLFAGGDPDDAVGEGPLHHFVVGEGLGQHGFADASHAGQRSEGDGLAVVFGKQRVAQRVQGFRPLQVVGDARRSGEVGDAGFAVGVGKGGGGVAADVGQEFGETRGVVGVVGEVAILPGVEV